MNKLKAMILNVLKEIIKRLMQLSGILRLLEKPRKNWMTKSKKNIQMFHGKKCTI